MGLTAASVAVAVTIAARAPGVLHDHALAAELLAVQLVNGVVGVAGVLELHEAVPGGRCEGGRPAGVVRPGARACAPPLPPRAPAAPRRRHLGGPATRRRGLGRLLLPTGPAAAGPGRCGRTWAPSPDSPIFKIYFEKAAIATEKALDVLLPDVVAQASYVDARHVRGGRGARGLAVERRTARQKPRCGCGDSEGPDTHHPPQRRPSPATQWCARAWATL